MRLARAARLFAGVVRPDAVLAEADRAALGLLGDALAREHVPLLRGVGPVLVINTVVVVAAAERGLVRRPVRGRRYYLGRSLARRAFDRRARGGFSIPENGCLATAGHVGAQSKTIIYADVTPSFGADDARRRKEHRLQIA